MVNYQKAQIYLIDTKLKKQIQLKMSATNRNVGAFRFYILEKRCDYKERMVVIHHEHLKLALCLQICVTSI